MLAILQDTVVPVSKLGIKELVSHGKLAQDFRWVLEPLDGPKIPASLAPLPKPSACAPTLDRWVAFFHGRIGSKYVFAEFEDQQERTSDRWFLRRLPTACNESTVIRATVQGGSCLTPSTVQFKLSAGALAFFPKGHPGWHIEPAQAKISPSLERP